MRTLILAATSVLLCALSAHAAGPIPRLEHPRPDLERPDWLNLNGEWQWEVDDKGDGEQRQLTTGTDLARKIIVPFPPESRLSGIGNGHVLCQPDSVPDF